MTRSTAPAFKDQDQVQDELASTFNQQVIRLERERERERMKEV